MKKRIKILHFENEPVFTQMYMAKFKQIGFDYINYTNPPIEKGKLIKLTLKENPDLILMDIIMPNMDGISATEILKQNKETNRFPIFALSSLGGEDDIKKAVESGMEDFFISADYTPEQLVKSLKEYIKNPKKYDPRYKKIVYNEKDLI